MRLQDQLCRAAFIIAAACGWGLPALGDDWPQWRGPQRDGVWRETAIVEKFDRPELTARWRTPIGSGYAGPAVANGRVYVTDRQKDKGTERVLCLDEATGRVAWTHEYACSYKGVDYDSGPRCTPTVHEGKVYALGAMGHLFCLNSRSGEVIWSWDYVKDFGAKLPTWGIASAPLVDGRRLIAMVGGKDGAGVIAFDKDTGKPIWRALSIPDIGYAPPMIYPVGTTRQLIIWHAEAVVSLDPETGKVFWQEPFQTDMAVTIIPPTLDGSLLFVSQFWAGPLMLRLAGDRPAAKVLWRLKPEGNPNEDMVNSLMSAPILRDGYLYAVSGYGALRCLKAETGERVWETYDATGHGRYWNAFLVPNGDRVFLANEQGELIIARISPKGYEEISRATLIKPTSEVLKRKLVWSHPAFANRCIYARNDEEIICVSLAR